MEQNEQKESTAYFCNSYYEGDYLKGYSIYVRDKERELRTLITKLNERHNNNAIKDEIIYELKQ